MSASASRARSSRGPDCFFGYTDPARTAEAIDADGWYATGDIGVLDEDGCLSITDRKKDIIIRGGENISAQEVEELIVRIPGVAECAVVARPIRASASTRRSSCACCRGTTTRRSLRCVRTSKRPASLARSGPRTCGRSRSSRAPRAEGAEVRAQAAVA